MELVDAKQYAKDEQAIIMENLNYALDIEGRASRTQISRMFIDRGINLPQGVISGYTSKKGAGIMSIAVLRDICEIIGVSMDEITRHDYIDKQKSKARSTKSFVRLLFDNLFSRTKDFIYNVDKYAHEFRGIVNTTFYCYFTPTQHHETKTLFGTMTFSVDNNMCFPKFSLDTGSTNIHNGQPLVKEYNGILLFAPKVNCYYCIFIGEEVGELCFMSFRYISLNGRLIDCRVAEVLTASSGEDRYPTTHRMLLSRQKIEEDDLALVLPHLKLNSSDIYISKHRLEAFLDETLGKDVLSLPKSEEVYLLKENHIRTITQWRGLSNADTLKLLSQIRTFSFADRYNKVSQRLDDNVRDLLISRGYYTEQL